jgi:putative transposase
MSGPNPISIELTDRQNEILKKLSQKHTIPQRLARRVNIILKASVGNNNKRISEELKVTRYTVRTWRKRWKENQSILEEVELKEKDDKKLIKKIIEILTDNERPGTPGIFTAEQIVQIVALACESPQMSDRPISHWTNRELGDEAVKRKIVESISPRSVGRFLKGSGITPS